MIRINLLGVERKPTTARVTSAQKLTVGCSLLLVATCALLGWRFWSLREASARLDTDIQAAQAETRRLHSVLQQVADFEKRRVQLQERVALIEELRKGQSGPVHLLDEVSRALPDRLWLTQLHTQGSEVRVEGRTMSLTSLSDFVGNLETSGYFARPVEILDSQVETQREAQGSVGGDVVRFTVKAQFTPPGITPATPTDEGSGPAARPAVARR